LGIIGGGITIPGPFIGNAMSGYAGRRRRVDRRTGAHGRRIIGQGRDRNRDGRTMVEDSGRNLGDPTMEDRGRSRDGRIMVADFDLSPVDRIMVGGPDRNLGDRTTVEDRGRSRDDLTMARALGRNLVGRIMVAEFDLSPVDRIMAGGPDRNPGDRTTVEDPGLSRVDRTMVRVRVLNRVGLTLGRDRNPIGRMVGNGPSLRGLTTARDLSRLSPAVAAGRAGRRLVSRARLPLIGAPSRPTGATNAHSRSDRRGS
jgi:hypothetical protein